MGKIRIKKIGDLDFEEKQKEEARRRAEAKKAKKQKKKTARAPGLKGGERIVAVGPSLEELEKIEPSKKEEKELPKAPKQVKPVKGRGKAPKKIKKRSKRYLAAKKKIDREKEYPISEAVKLVKEVSISRFDGTVEAHIKVNSKDTKGEVALPYKAGKQRRIKIASDKLLADIEKGKIDFDVLIAHPKMMPKLVKFAKILGPKGLMPNPKAGTIVDNPEKKAKEFEKGAVSFQCERNVPLIHFSIGKVSFPEERLAENLKALLSAIGTKNIKKVILSPTMGPGVRVKFAEI